MRPPRRGAAPVAINSAAVNIVTRDFPFETGAFTDWDAYFADFIANDPGIQYCIKHADDDAFYAGPAHIDEWELPAALAGLADLWRWVAWRNEPNSGKPLIKAPYQSVRKKAKTNDPTTWLPLDAAKAVAHAIAGEFGLGGGVGIVLGGLGDGACLIGIDLDSCRDPEEGDLEPWAAEVIERFGSYTEVSPSKTGAKIFALVAPSDLPTMRTILGGPDGRQFKRSGGAHPPAIEVSTDGRYFTVTGWRRGNGELRSIPIEDFRWLIEEFGPNFAGKTQGRDASRSAVAFRKGGEARRNGRTFEEMVEALRADPRTTEWVEEKGERDGQRELRRIWDRADPHALDDFPLTEDGVALAFAAKFEDQLKYCHHKGAWYEWVGTHWRLEETKLAFSWARNICRQLAQERQKTSAMSTARQAAAVEKFAQSDRAFSVTSANWDRDEWLLGTPGGVVDLRTGQLREAEQSDFITKLTAAAPADKADCPLWLKFLREATNGDNDLIRFLQQWTGYCLTGDTREHALLFVYGDGGNGKSVFLRTVSKTVGDYCCVAAMDTFTASRNDRHPTDMAMLRGARMVSAAETEEGRAWAEVRIKQMTGGDDITARFMHQDFFTFTPQFKLTLVGNHKPILRNVDDAARRRFNMAPFVHKPSVVDRQLEVKLTAEWPAILRWMIDGCLDWQANGLIRPKAVIEATAKYFGEQDTLRQWVDECCHVGPDLVDTNANLFMSWSDYAKLHGEDVGSQKRLNPAMERLGFFAIKDQAGIRGRGFKGLKVCAPGETPGVRKKVKY